MYQSLPEGFHLPEDLGEPGEFPYTRGVYPSMYRGRVWTMRQYAGFGTAEETNQRYQYLLAQGTTGLSVAFDLPTQMGYDSDAEMAAGEVGRVGVAIDSIEDMQTLFSGVDQGQVSCSMTINATAPILLALYVAVSDQLGVSRKDLRGTVQNDILKEYIARGTYIYPVEASLRMVGDLMAFCSVELPKWNTISISGYHIREAGSTAAQELAFTLANGLEYVERALGAGIELEDFAPRLSFFFAAHNDLLEEVAKFRAARRMWARLLKSRYGASDRACRLRFHTQTGGSTLTAQQPLNNVVRVTLQALAAVLGGTQSLHTNGYDEALSLPTEEAAGLALRTQQVIAEESGVTEFVDPLGGSFVVEALTNRLEAEATAYVDRIADSGGAAKATEYMQDEIHRAAYQFQLDVESGDQIIVGVNRYTDAEETSPIEGPDYHALETRQKTALRVLKQGRDQGVAMHHVERLRAVAKGDANVMPIIIDAVKAKVTLGEISDAFRDVWGTHDAPKSAPSDRA
ncbi:MAG: acyl-CoA mutase large subunit family protein [Longimicrobiales bacterium]